MARATRRALDFALVSLRTVKPVVSKLWISAKSFVENSKARSLVANPVVHTAEALVYKMTKAIISSLTYLRDRQLPKEQIYLEKELEKVKDRIKKMDQSLTSKTLKPVLANVWQYAKVELVPPMTVDFFHGPVGKRLEDTVSKAADGIITNIQNKINDIEAEKAREIKRKIAEAKAAQERVRAEAKKKAEEAKMKEAEMLAKEAKAKKDAQAAEAAKKSQAPPPPKATKPDKKPKKKPRKSK